MKITIETGEAVKVSVGDDPALAFEVDRLVATIYGDRAVIDLPDTRRVVVSGDRAAVTELGATVSESAELGILPDAAQS